MRFLILATLLLSIGLLSNISCSQLHDLQNIEPLPEGIRGISRPIPF